MPEIIALAAFLATAVQLLFWTVVFSRLARAKAPPPPRELPPPLTLLICVRDEEKNLRKNLDRFLNQNHHSLEIIVVNDNSRDNSLAVLLEFQEKYPNLTVVNVVAPTPPGKKAALTEGIRFATTEVILLTDIDCIPGSPFWAEYMQSSLNNNWQIGLGFSPYSRERGVLNAFIRFEAVYTAVQYLSFALAGMPYMGVGRNLIYHRNIFWKAGGMKDHLDLASGDDDLLINRMANARNTTIQIDPKAFTFSIPKKTWRGYYYQKSRHLTAGVRYRMRHRLWLGLLAASHLAHSLLLAILFWLPGYVLFALALWLIRLSIVLVLYARILSRLQQRDLLPWIPLLDLGYCLFYLVFAPGLVKTNKRSWK